MGIMVGDDIEAEIIMMVSESITIVVAKSYLLEQGTCVVLNVGTTWTTNTLLEAKLLEERFLVNRDREYLTFRIGPTCLMVKIENVQII